MFPRPNIAECTYTDICSNGDSFQEIKLVYYRIPQYVGLGELKTFRQLNMMLGNIDSVIVFY